MKEDLNKMDEQNVDFNDAMFQINDQPQQQEIASTDNDSHSAHSGQSISGFGIDIDNPQENYRYIQENQDPQAIIQGIGVAARYSDEHSEERDSGRATSISKTRNSEFIPEIIEYERNDSCKANSNLNETIETPPGPSSGERYGYDPKYDESKELAESLEEIDISTYDLALGRGYQDQAKIAYDDAISKGLPVKTKYELKLKDFKKEFLNGDNINYYLEAEDDYWDEKHAFNYMHRFKTDLREYVENLEKNEYKKVLEKLNSRDKMLPKFLLRGGEEETIEFYQKPEKEIKKCIKTKQNRNNLQLKEETIRIIKKCIEELENTEQIMRQALQKGREERTELIKSISKGCELLQDETGCCNCKLHQENQKKSDDDFDKDGATGFSRSSTITSSSMNEEASTSGTVQ